jgi:hypothetical protein
MTDIATIQLDEYEEKVLRALEPEYEYLILIIPGRAGVNSFAAGSALATLKKKKLVAFDGRGRFKSAYLTDDGVTRRAALPEVSA